MNPVPAAAAGSIKSAAAKTLKEHTELTRQNKELSLIILRVHTIIRERYNSDVSIKENIRQPKLPDVFRRGENSLFNSSKTQSCL